MKTSVLGYGKQTDSLRKVSLPLSRMETEHPPGTQVSLEPSVHVCLISQWEVHSIKASRNLQVSFWDKVTLPLNNLQPYFTHKNKKSEESTACEPCQKPPRHFCRHCLEQKKPTIVITCQSKRCRLQPCHCV